MIENKKDYIKGMFAGIIFVILMDIFFKFMYEDGSSFSESIVFGFQLIWIIASEYPIFSIVAVMIMIIAYFLVSDKFSKFEKKTK